MILHYFDVAFSGVVRGADSGGGARRPVFVCWGVGREGEIVFVC